jgi:hypothetical protein
VSAFIRCGRLLLMSVVLCACVTVPVAEAPGAKKRVAPEPVEPITIGSVRYEVVPWAKTRGMDQDGGVIRAVDAASGRELWLLKVYEIKIDPAMETDKQEIFIARLTQAADGRSLLVDTERGARYRVDLATRAVVREAGGGTR